MSTIKTNQWLNLDGTENFKCRAWVNFNGTGAVAIRAAGNVASITDNGTGDYTVNFATALPDANYCPTLFARSSNVVNLYMSRSRIAAPTAAAFRFDIFNSSVVAEDCIDVCVGVFR